MIATNLDIFVAELEVELTALMDSSTTIECYGDEVTGWVRAYGITPFGDLMVKVPFGLKPAQDLGARKTALWLEPIVLHEFKKRINLL